MHPRITDVYCGRAFWAFAIACGLAACGGPGQRDSDPSESAPGAIEASPSFDCARADSEVQELICGDPGLAALDRHLASVYSQALAVVDAIPGEGVARFRAEQRGWIGGRDACWMDDEPTECIRREYSRRTAVLEARYGLVESTSTVRWTCDGNPANEFVTTFFPTDPPSARIERGDQSEIGLLTPTASGARYDATFGKFVWVRGIEATAQWPQDATWSCVRAEGAP